MAKTKTRAANIVVPQSREEAATALREIGELGRELTRREAQMNDDLARIKEQIEGAAQPLRERREELTQGLRTWCEANRTILTAGNRVKFADLGTGKISWRFRPPKVSLPRDVAGLIERLRSKGLGRFVRTKEEVDREGMLADPAAVRGIPGIRIGSEGEDFIVEPFEAELEAAA